MNASRVETPSVIRKFFADKNFDLHTLYFVNRAENDYVIYNGEEVIGYAHETPKNMTKNFAISDKMFTKSLYIMGFDENYHDVGNFLIG